MLSRVCGLVVDFALSLGGVGGLSSTFEADEVVGRIMRARNPSSAGATCFGRLCRDA